MHEKDPHTHKSTIGNKSYFSKKIFAKVCFGCLNLFSLNVFVQLCIVLGETLFHWIRNVFYHAKKSCIINHFPQISLYKYSANADLGKNHPWSTMIGAAI